MFHILNVKEGMVASAFLCMNHLKEVLKFLKPMMQDIYGLKYANRFFSLPEDICICFAYIPPPDSVYFKMHNIGFFELLEEGIRKYSMMGRISIIDVLNARCGSKSDIIQDSQLFDKYIPAMDAYDENSTLEGIPGNNGKDL